MATVALIRVCATSKYMSEVGIRALKQNASAVVAEAAAGETVTITDRGRPVAQMTAIPTSRLRGLIDAGRARPARHELADLSAAILGRICQIASRNSESPLVVCRSRWPSRDRQIESILAFPLSTSTSIRGDRFRLLMSVITTSSTDRKTERPSANVVPRR